MMTLYIPSNTLLLEVVKLVRMFRVGGYRIVDLNLNGDIASLDFERKEKENV